MGLLYPLTGARDRIRTVTARSALCSSSSGAASWNRPAVTV